ncbi:cation:proton antiporter [Limibacter armeniacum]|uniref:cation:proton antiporter n=1 Tax=Limibacter armeniacum TaxID=466084 RepID=UPI002FE6C0C4
MNLLILAGFIFMYALIAKRIEVMTISGPIIFLAFGIIMGPNGIGILKVSEDRELIKTLAELTLALVLFTDASMAKVNVIKQNLIIPKRLLLFGLPMIMLLGFGFGYILFGELSTIEIAILAVSLAPTDAALGKAVITNTNVPERIREGLNVESGLNDGICVPFLLLCFSFLEGKGEFTYGLFAKQIIIGAGVGLAVTFLGHSVISLSEQKNSISHSWKSIVIIVLAFSMFSLAQILGGSGFIACFAGGILYSIIGQNKKEEFINAAEGFGDSLAIATWVVFGASFVIPAFNALTPAVVLYALLSLTVVRMLPVYLVLLGTDIDTRGKIFIGWFGPRGLATIVFVVMAAEKHLNNGPFISLVAICTIVFSIVGHGFSANPLANWLAKKEKK